MKFIESYQLKNWYKYTSSQLYYYFSYPGNHPYALLQQDASRSSADYIKHHMPHAVPYFCARDLLLHALSVASREGEFAEFGVYKGSSLNAIARVARNKTVWGFDSFEGLPADWIMPKGSFSLGGKLPRVENNVKLVKGLFSETAYEWFNSIDKVSFLHIDCDLFQSANDVLEAFAGSRSFKPSIESGVVIVFDDYFNQPFWERDSHLAFTQFLDRNKTLRVTYMAYASEEVSVRITAA